MLQNPVCGSENDYGAIIDTLGKVTAVQRPLTILLPVRNAQSTLTDTVGKVLDLAANVSDRFEILIIDDASTDATNEVVHELRSRYPQIRVITNKKALGEDAAVRLVSSQIRGEVARVRPAATRCWSRFSPATKTALPSPQATLLAPYPQKPIPP